MYFVGRSFVSAITHTPASGPFAPVTTPPMSLASTRTAAPAGCAAAMPTEAADINAVTLTLSRQRPAVLLILICFPHLAGVNGDSIIYEIAKDEPVSARVVLPGDPLID